MDEEIIQHAMLVFGLSLLVGPVVGGLAGWLKNFFWGVGVGALLIGCAGLYAAATIGWQRYQSIEDTASVQGSLVEFVEERSKDSDGRTTVSRAPVIEYVTADGQKRLVKGLGGSLPDKEWGDAVEVRYSIADPAQALVADFQNMWGPVWGFSIFGLFPTMFGLFFTGMAIKEGRPAGKRPVERAATPAQQRWRTRGTVLANLVFVAGFAVCFLYPEDSIGKALGAGFMTIGAGALLHFVVQSFPPAMAFESRSILAIVGLGFLAFGYGAWMMLG